jgi:hypothetical protein
MADNEIAVPSGAILATVGVGIVNVGMTFHEGKTQFFTIRVAFTIGE